MKNFLYDTILSKENICNLEQEQKALDTGVKLGKKLVVYGPRNYGKTSLIQSVIIPAFKKRHKHSFVFQVDLMEIRDQTALAQRIIRAFERSFTESFPNKSLFELAKKFLFSLRPTIEIDPMTSLPSLSISSENTQLKEDWTEIFKTIREEIATEYPTLLVFDEFQDIAFVDGAQGMLRQALQAFNEVPIIILGSKQHILSQIFAVPKAPLANFGEDIEFKTISYKKYYAYMQERFKQKELSIDEDLAQRIQDTMQRVPEAINIVCADLYNNLSNKKISWKDITKSLNRVMHARRSRYETMLSLFTAKEEEVLVAIGKYGPISHPTGKNFLRKLDITSRSVGKIVKSFFDSSIIYKTESGYQISDPLLKLFIAYHR